MPIMKEKVTAIVRCSHQKLYSHETMEEIVLHITHIQLGQNIRTYRRASHMTIEALADAIHKSKATVSKYEQGGIALDVDTLFDIAEALHVRPQMLLQGLRKVKENRPVSAISGGVRRYLYLFDGRTNRIVRGLCVIGAHGDDEIPVSLFYNIPSFDEPSRCRVLYLGRVEHHEFVTNFLLEDHANGIEHVFICLMKPLNSMGQESGLLSGISSRTLLPASAKCILSDVPLAEDDALITRLLLTKEDIRLTKKFNMFTLEQTDL